MRASGILAWIIVGALAAAQTVDREIAARTIFLGGRVRIAGQKQYIGDIAELPAGNFELEAVDWLGVNADPPDLALLTGAIHLKELRLPGPLWNRNVDGGVDLSRELRHVAPLTGLEILTFGYHFLDRIRFRDEGLTQIRNLTNLRELALRQTGITGAALTPFVKLRSLDLTLCPVNDAGMRSLRDKTELRRLWLGDTAITNAGLLHLTLLTQLEELDLHGTRITDDGLRRLVRHGNLRKLNLMGTGITDAGLSVLVTMPKLEELNLYRTKVSNSAGASLRKLPALRVADLRYTRMSKAGVDGLRAALPSARIVFSDSGAGGAGAPTAPPSRRDDASVAAWVQKLGGKAMLENGALVEISLRGCGVTDEQVAVLVGLRRLRTLDLEATEIGDLGAWQIAKIGSLTGLSLNSTSISDAALAPLGKLTGLRRLNLGNTYVDGSRMRDLAGLPAIRELLLDGSPVDDDGLAALEGLTSLRRLSLAYTDITDAGMAAVKALSGMEELDLSGTDIGDAGLAAAASLAGLRTLSLRESRITDKGLASLVSLSGLRKLDLLRTRVSDDGAESIGRLTELRELILDYSELKSVEGLAALRKIEVLSLDSTHVGDPSARVLKSFAGLKTLNLYHTLLTESGVNSLKQALPGCRIIWDKDSSAPNRRRS